MLTPTGEFQVSAQTRVPENGRAREGTWGGHGVCLEWGTTEAREPAPAQSSGPQVQQGSEGRPEKMGGGSKAVPRTIHPLHPSNLNVSSRKMNQSPSLRDGNHPFFLQDAGKWRAYGTILAAMTHCKAVTEVQHLLPIITPPISPSLSASTLALLVWCLVSGSNIYPKECELFERMWDFSRGGTLVVPYSLFTTVSDMNTPKYTPYLEF